MHIKWILSVGVAGALTLSTLGLAQAGGKQPYCQGRGLPKACAMAPGEIRYYRCTQCNHDQVLELVGGNCDTGEFRTCSCKYYSEMLPGKHIIGEARFARFPLPR
jgi:hypothetical protein